MRPSFSTAARFGHRSNCGDANNNSSKKNRPQAASIVALGSDFHRRVGCIPC